MSGGSTRSPLLVSERFLDAAESLYARVVGSVRSATVALTRACNLHCSYCYQSRDDASAVSWDVLRATLDLILASAYPRPRVIFTGGEPLLELALLRRAAEYVAKASRATSPPRLIVATNGTLLDSNVAAMLAAHHVRVQLSMDGVAPAQDQRGAGTFEHLDYRLRELARELPEYFRDSLSVHVTLTARNLTHLAESVRYFLRRGVSRVVVIPLITQDASWRTEMIDELDRQLATIHELSVSHLKRTGETPITLFRRRQRTASARPQDGPMCGVTGGEGLFVDVDGAVSGCPALGGSLRSPAGDMLEDVRRAAQLGDVREPGLDQRLTAYRRATRQLSMLNARLEKYSSYGRCAECDQLSWCQVCPVSIGHIPGNTDPHRVPDLQCAFNLVAGEQTNRFRSQL